MIVLGLIGLGENPAACLVRDGVLVAMAEEERFTRLKASHGMFPTRAAAWCLGSEGLELGDVDRIAFGWDADRYPWQVGRTFARTYARHRGRSRKAQRTEGEGMPMSAAADVLLQWHPARVREAIRHGLRAGGAKGDIPPVEFVEHHVAHAWSAYPLSGFDRAGILTMDGSGETTCTQLAIGEGDRVRVLDRIPIPNSLGWFYAAVTQYLGFLPYRDEGKLMGLAALGEERRDHNRFVEPLSKVLTVDGASYEVDPVYTQMGSHYYGDRFTDELADLLTSVDPTVAPIAYGEKAEIDGRPQSRYLLEPYVDIAWAAQELLERAALGQARRLVQDHGVEDLCLAGGVALNCKMNGELLRHSGAKRIFVQPAANDAGAALGAALYVAAGLGDDVRRPLEHVYYGPGFDNGEIKAALDGSGLDYQLAHDPATQAAEALEQGRIIAWFQGRMEFGARALGGRSILANPVQAGTRDRLNHEVKYREYWRPFCPSVAGGCETDYLVAPGEAGYMIVAYEGTDRMQENLPAVVHVDGTIRPQVVRREANPAFHDLIDEFGKRTGHPVVLNTSFNVRGEPIICTPLEAVRCFYSNGLESLFIGDFILTK